ncbi:MAG TPA: hypothetical protein VFV79_06475 [Saprospiraceae bacterium]|nr:hypothetical protein [Saprospiraceae bacterium]
MINSYKNISLAFLTMLLACHPKVDVSGVYNFVITQAILTYYSDGRMPIQELDRVIVDEYTAADQEFYEQKIKDPGYTRIKLSFDDIEMLRTRDRYEFSCNRNNIIRVSDEIFFTNHGDFVAFYQIDKLGRGTYYRLHFKDSNGRFDVVENVAELMYQE